MTSSKETTTPLAARLTASLWPIPRARWGLCFLPLVLVISLTPPAWRYVSRFVYRAGGCYLPVDVSVIQNGADGSVRLDRDSSALVPGESRVGLVFSPHRWDDSALIPYPLRDLRRRETVFDVHVNRASITSTQWEELALQFWNDILSNTQSIQVQFASQERDQNSLHVVVNTLIGSGDIIWPNLLRNILWWSSAFGWVWSFLWLLRCPPWTYLRVRAQARRSRNQCPHCAYSLQGLPPTSANCPECGAGVTPALSPPPVA